MVNSAFGQLGYEPLAGIPVVGQLIVPTGAAASTAPYLLGPEKELPLLRGGTAADEQFMLFQLGDDARPIKDLTEVTPAVAGSETEPDIQASVSLLAFHLAESKARNVTDTTRATLRLDLGKDSASNSPFEPLFWSVAAGLELYDHVKSGTNERDPKRMSDDLSAKFGRRPVEIPGGLGQLRIEIMAHPEKPWWRRALGFLGENQSVRQIVNSVGFPGIALNAVRMIDEMLGRFEDAAAEPLLRSRPLTLAFSQAAKDDFTGGSPITRMGCITPGFYVLVRQSDSERLRTTPPLFLGSTGHLVPKAAWDKNPGAINPEMTEYRDITYAVLKFRARAFKLGGL